MVCGLDIHNRSFKCVGKHPFINFSGQYFSRHLQKNYFIQFSLMLNFVFDSGITFSVLAGMLWSSTTFHFIGPMKYSVHQAIDQLVPSCHKSTAAKCTRLHTQTHTPAWRHKASKWGQRWLVVIHLTSMTTAANKSLIHHLIHRLSPTNSPQAKPSQNTLLSSGPTVRQTD